MKVILKKEYVSIVAILSVLGLVYWFAFNFLRQVEFDTPSFLGASRLMFGLEGGYNFQSRLSKPLVLVLPGLLELVFGLNARYGFLIQNALAHYAVGFVIYKIVLLLTGNKKSAILGVIAYAMCNPFAVYSLFYLVDTVGWLWGCYTIYLVLKYLQGKQIRLKHVMSISVFASLGMLCKESAIVGFIFLIVYLSILNIPVLLKLKYILFAFLVWLVPFVTSNLITEHLYGVSIFSRTVEQLNTEGFVYYSVANFQQLFRVIDVYWFLLAFGIYSFIKNHKKNVNSKAYWALLITVIISLLTMPVYPFIVDRILFMIAPALIVFTILGSDVFNNNNTIVVIVAGIINVVLTWVIYKYDISGMLLTMYILYFVFLMILFLKPGFAMESSIKLN